MKKSPSTQQPFALRSPLHGFVALCALTVIEGWPLLLCFAIALAMSAPA